MMLSACSLFESQKKVITVPKDYVGQTVEETKTAAVPSQLTKPSRKPATSKRAPVASKNSTAEAPAQIAMPESPWVEVPQLDGEWTVWTVDGKKVTGEERPYINFSNTEHRFYGNNGCNTLNGAFLTGAGKSILFSEMISTMMTCPDAPFEMAINQALDKVRYYNISRKGQEVYIDLLDDHKAPVMVLRRHNMDFLNGAWMPTEINGERNTNEEVEMVIDLAEQKLHGRTGCNLVNGTLLIDPDKNNSIQFQALGSTRMMCDRDVMATETALLVALESVEHAHPGKNGTVVMSDKDGKTVLILKPVALQRPE